MGEARRRRLARLNRPTPPPEKGLEAIRVVPLSTLPSRARAESDAPTAPSRQQLARRLEGANRWVLHYPDGRTPEAYSDPAMLVGRLSLDVPIEPAEQAAIVAGLRAGYSGAFNRGPGTPTYVLEAAIDPTIPLNVPPSTTPH